MPLGADKVLKTDVRIVTATHADLNERMENGTFRPDLYYRLCSHRLDLPPLRQRLEDIPLLVEYFVDKAAKSLNKPCPVVPSELSLYLAAYRFPGNIRELAAMIHDAVARNNWHTLPLESFVTAIGGNMIKPTEEAHGSPRNQPWPFGDSFPTLKEAEEFLISEALRLSNNNQRLAATYLGLTRQGLSKRLTRANK